MRSKLWIIRIGVMVAFAVLVGHMYTIQIQQGDQYAQRAHARQDSADDHEMRRGLIYFTDKFSNLVPAVFNKEYPVVYAVPQEVDNPEAAARELAPLVAIDEAELVRMLSKPNDQYELLVERATAAQVESIRATQILGIYVTHQDFRYYPFGTMASQLLGFIAPSQDGLIRGRYGAELTFDTILAGEGDNEGQAVVLSIDRSVQAEAEKVATELLRQWNAESASVVVQDPNTGKILAMANTPQFDPNAYFEYSLESFQNPIIEEVYEPGSVFKVITIAAGIDSGAITPATTYYDSGSITLNGRTIQNWDEKSHGTQTIANVLEKSLNTGSVFAEQQTGHTTFAKYVERFGFGDASGIALPGEVSGNIANIYNGRDIHYATASFGQGISVTPIQMITAFSTVANGGVLYQPSILADQDPLIVRRVLREETAQQMTDMLVGAVDENVVAHIPQYTVTGKTGTAFVPDFVNGGYSDDVINTYIGYAPASDPQFTVLVRLAKPEGAPLAGQTVVPAYKRMVEYLLNYFEVAPDRPIKQ